MSPNPCTQSSTPKNSRYSSNTVSAVTFETLTPGTGKPEPAELENRWENLRGSLSEGSAMWIVVVALLLAAAKGSDVACEWKSNTGTLYDLKGLTVPKKSDSYFIIDGDIPCSDVDEPQYDFVWNMCADVTASSIPNVCSDKKGAAAMQYISRSDGYEECEIIGNYDKKHDDSHFSLIDTQEPSMGVQMKYKSGSMCKDIGKARSATIEVHCANYQEPLIVSALEHTECQYTLIMKSVHGCPTECKSTKNGLCNSHGYCAWDPALKEAYCLCNDGYSGDSCTENGSDKVYDGLTVQVGLLVTLLIVTLSLIGVIGVMIYRIKSYSVGDGRSVGTFNPLGMLPNASDFDKDGEDEDPHISATELRNFDRFSENNF